MKINGKEYKLVHELTLYDWVFTHVKEPKHVAAAEVNGDIFPSAFFNTVKLKNSDVIELVYFMGGG